jgi:arylsulfatase A-like enzyme/Flp pilus assembly protein TadD
LEDLPVRTRRALSAPRRLETLPRFAAIPTLAALAPIAIGILTNACGAKPAEPPPVVLISIDTLRSDRLPAYGYRAGSTPAIDRLAKDGVLFERAFAQVPLTLPSHSSLLTGLLPPVHGVRDNVGFSLPAGAGTTLAERLARLGYATGGAASTFVMRAGTGIGRGFERYDAPEDAERPAGATLAPLLPWLEEWRARRFLLFFHLYEPHAPYKPPADLAGRFPDPYDGEVAAADRAVGELLAALDRLGLYEKSLIVLLSDHGEGLGDHGDQEHGFLLYREAIQVPLLVKLPGRARAGERIAGAVGLTDVLPTLLAAVGAPTDPALPGRDLLAPAKPGAGSGPASSKPVYSETWSTFIHFGWSELLSAVDGRFHYIDSPKPELYDLDRDPGELTNLISDERRAGSALRAFLDGFPRELEPPEQETDPESLAKLAALGYLAPQAPAASDGPRPNPRDELVKTAPILRGMRLVNEGRFAEAVAVLQPAVATQPDALLGWQYLGRALDALGRKAEAKAAFANTLHGAERDSFMISAAALRLLDLGRVEQALDLVRRELRRNQAGADLRVVESRALLLLGRTDEAMSSADRAVAADARMADARYQRAVVALTLGRAEPAEADLRAALAIEPRHLQATKMLATLRYRMGDPVEAKRLLERALELAPGDPDAEEGLALLARGGR